MSMPMSIMLASCLLMLLTLSAVAGRSSRPNIVFILTDDQDVFLFGQNPLPKAQELIGKAGMSFPNMFVTSPLCCPSRSSILTGKYLHNHHVLNNSISGGCGSSAWQKNEEMKAFPPYLKLKGYETFFAGKYLNTGSKKAGGVQHVPPGWDFWNGLVGNSKYYNYSLSVDGKEEVHGNNYTEDYLTDVIHKRAINFLKTRSSRHPYFHHPFFMMLSTPACHAPFDSAPQYMKNFTDKKAPRTKSFNVAGKDKHWLVQRALNPMPADTIETIDDTFRKRWRTLLSVDDMIENLVNQLKAMDELDNTYIFFTSDNGYHLGQFSLPYDKRQLYDFDIRVPLMVRGPGIKAGSMSNESIMSIDLAPTFLDIVGLNASTSFDGYTFMPILTGQQHPFRASVLVEYHGEHTETISHCPKLKGQRMFICNNHCVCEDSWNNTYGCIRHETAKQSFKYCALQDHQNFLEVYDLKADPDELKNIAKSASPDLLTMLSQELAALSLCKGPTCHPSSPVVPQPL